MFEIGARETRPSSKMLGEPLTNALIFFSIVLAGCTFIIYAKLSGYAQAQITFVPVAIMITYALAIGIVKSLQLRDDQSGDNLYYMGFLFTLTSLGVSLYQFSVDATAELIVQNFGIAIASTIAGIALRVFFNQMRRDPVEVEATARNELSDAARRVRRELDSTLLEFSNFRRSAQQMVLEGMTETNNNVSEVSKTLLSSLEDVTKKAAAPLEAASKNSSATLEELTRTVVSSLNASAEKLAQQSERLSVSARKISETLDGMSAKLAAMKTPDEVIEIKLNPTIQGLSRAVNAFTKSSESQTSSIKELLEGTLAAVKDNSDLLKASRSEADIRASATDDAIQSTAKSAKEMLDAVATLKIETEERDMASRSVLRSSANTADALIVAINSLKQESELRDAASRSVIQNTQDSTQSILAAVESLKRDKPGTAPTSAEIAAPAGNSTRSFDGFWSRLGR